MADLVERTVAYIFQNRRGHDAGLFHKTSPFANHPTPTIPLDCDIGPSGSPIPKEYSVFDKVVFPTLSWPAQSDVTEYLLVVEDPDAPLAEPVVHGLYYGIPPWKTRVVGEDFEVVEGAMKGGFRYGVNRKGTVYMPPRGLLGHGPHRYSFQVVALGGKVNGDGLGAKGLNKEEIVNMIEGRVLGWGKWEGIWERTE
ncbi:YbhB/YbcL family Raf kinase inhibitor-like protein [Aspergillus alliaceus]|uniref:YbhB/YbcL family Raf kinase inhibitor-like protein n=1 Tax=Petromyces alliaceus TaxID=209559 RepID=UPI0012A6E29B|nr:PEBP-like protein [Aspergillus alliaceus]KAB8227723.1 PEBP-like protein [Aspergillus alliaceus]